MTIRSFPLLAFLISSSLSLTGCSNMTATATPVPEVQAGDFAGLIHGGRQPVSNSTVILWAAGNTGYGSTATELVATTSDSNGNFSFGPSSGHTYTCPSSTSTTVSQQLYITATGGQPTTGTTNSAAAFLLALGDCATVQGNNPTVSMNEVTTTASVYALQQFISLTTAPTPLSGTTIVGLGSIGSSAANITGMRNAFLTVNNLANVAAGVSMVNTFSAAVGGYTTNPTVTVTPDITKINTIADILAACVNTAGSSSNACSTLFNDAANTPAKDTVQAAYDLAVNPTSTTGTTTPVSNIQAIYNTSVAQSPFAPSMSSAPADWTIGVTYGSNSFQTIAATTSPVAAAGTAYLLTNPQWIGIDTQGNVWVSNNATSSATTPGNSAVQLSGVGIPEAQVLTTAGVIVNPSGLVLDPANDVYVSSYGASGTGKSIAEYTNLSVAKTFSVTSSGPSAIASDGAGNIYVANYGTAAGSGDLEVIPVASATGAIASPQATAVSVGPSSSLAIDANNTLWLSNYNSTATIQFICSANPCAATSTTVATAPQSIAIDHSGNVWVGNISSTGAGSVAEIAETSTTTISAAQGSPYYGGGLANPFRGIIDGNGDVWETNYVAGGGTVSELTNLGVPISPSVGFVHTYNGASGMAIDRSGNVWIGNSGATASATTQGFITEIVGQAYPVITPLAAGLPATSGGANKIGIRP